jgi:ABC-type transport system involved in cytochrome c biogenesis ATPase subunit
VTALLRLSGVTAFYGAIQALKGVDLEVDEGEIVTLIGANGAGKSTLMMTICGTPRARDGSILYAGRDITGQPTYEIMRQGIAQSPEGRRIFPRMSVHENLLMGAHGLPAAEVPRTLEQVFSLFPRLQERMAQRGGTLSGGEQQMLSIGRALGAQSGIGAAGGAVDLWRDPRPQSRVWPDGAAGRAECLPGAPTGASWVCAGERNDHDGRPGRRPLGEAGDQGGVSRGSGITNRAFVAERPVFPSSPRSRTFRTAARRAGRCPTLRAPPPASPASRQWRPPP